MKKFILISLALTLCTAFRYAWRPDTKVFPYDVFPEPEVIDNGDNSGKAYDEIIIK